MRNKWLKILNCHVRSHEQICFDLVRLGVYYDQWDAILPKEILPFHKDQKKRPILPLLLNEGYLSSSFPEIKIRSRRMSIWLKSLISQQISDNLLLKYVKLTGYHYPDLVEKYFYKYSLPLIKKSEGINRKYKILVKFRKHYPEIFYRIFISLSPPSGLIYEVIDWELRKIVYFDRQQDVIDCLFPYLRNQSYERKIMVKYPKLIYS